MMNPTMYYQTKIMSNLFLEKADANGVAFKDATQMDHFWGVSKTVINRTTQVIELLP